MIPVTDGLFIVAESPKNQTAPVFSICVPQFNRTSFLIEACKSLIHQTFRSFELCIADDRSTDSREDELISFLISSGLEFTYGKQITNRRYDGNLRSAIALARGEFVFLLGNDDRLAEVDTLDRINDYLKLAGPAQVIITNYKELGTGRTFRRAPRLGILGRGPAAAVQAFRSFSFVSGVIFENRAARSWATSKWDGSEMYQMYLGCRILAAGGTLAGIDVECIGKDIQISGEMVDSYAARKIEKRDFSAVLLPMARIAPLVTDALAPYLSRSSLEKTTAKIVAQLLLFTYAFWLVELRRVQSWKYAVSVYRGLAPKRLTEGSALAPSRKLLIALLYAIVGIGGLTMPIGLFCRLRPLLYRLAKREPSGTPAWTS
jgi:glycosyltransferase involved in cell wall biosynthesis